MGMDDHYHMRIAAREQVLIFAKSRMAAMGVVLALPPGRACARTFEQVG